MGSLPKASQGFQGSSGSFQAPSLSPGVVSATLRGLPQASSGSSLRSPSRASPRLPPGSSCLAGLWGNRGRSPYIMCRSLSRIFMQIFHSFSSRAVGAVFVATSLRHFAPVPPGVVSAASAELPPGFLPGVVGPRLFLQDFGRSRKDRGEIEEDPCVHVSIRSSPFSCICVLFWTFHCLGC